MKRYTYVKKHHSGRYEVYMSLPNQDDYCYCDYSNEAIAVSNAINLASACNIEYSGIIGEIA